MGSEKTVNTVSVSCGGIFVPLLAVLFIYLKLTGVIDWSWWWVLSPLWMPLAFVTIIILGVLFIVGGHAIWIHIKEQGD